MNWHERCSENETIYGAPQCRCDNAVALTCFHEIISECHSADILVDLYRQLELTMRQVVRCGEKDKETSLGRRSVLLWALRPLILDIAVDLLVDLLGCR